jgi:hypothetical protein
MKTCESGLPYITKSTKSCFFVGLQKRYGIFFQAPILLLSFILNESPSHLYLLLLQLLWPGWPSSR